MSTHKLSEAFSTIAWTLVIIAISAILLGIAVLIFGTLVLLIGRLWVQWFEIRVFEAALIALGTAALFLFVIMRRLSPTHVIEPVDEEDEWDDEDEDDMIIPPRSRNDPCPCGSGKKYKYCHGRDA